MREPDLSRGTRLYVPAPDSLIRSYIAAGSGIVGTDHGERVEIYYEGAIYNFSNIKTFEDRVYHAWDRCVQRYPTSATAAVKPEDLILVGEVLPAVRDTRGYPQIVITDQAAVDEWCAS